MSLPIFPTPGIRWHHRVLGVLWGFVGVIFIGSLLQHDSWADFGQWIALVLSFAFVATSIGFFHGRTWGRRIMGVLMVLAALFFLDAMAPASIAGNYEMVWLMRIGLAAVAYTWGFLAVPQAYSLDDLQ
ncbi:MAG TPA: hypothetical protein VKY92_22505 [Verrucomicrobiae bacterium]|nr:hypothetical protein [Verrucomicrobiae bacterium]